MKYREKILNQWIDTIHREDVTQFLDCYSYKELIRPLVLRDWDYGRGKSYHELARKYNVSRWTVRWICEKNIKDSMQ